LKGLLFLYTAALMEKKIFLLSKNKALLTGTLYAITAMLKPLKYQGANLFMLPDSEYYLEMIEGIGFNFYGIDKDEHYLFKKKIFQRDCEDSIFMCLDERNIYAMKETVASVTFPLFDNFLETLAPLYHKFNKDPGYGYNVKIITKDMVDSKHKKHEKHEKHVCKFGETGQTAIEDCCTIIDIFQDFFYKRILQLLPNDPIYKIKEGKILDMDAICAHMTNNNPRKLDVNLLQKLIVTQTFTTFLEEYYDAKERMWKLKSTKSM